MERVRSFHLSRQSFGSDAHDLPAGVGSGSSWRSMRQYSPAQKTIHEEDQSEAGSTTSAGPDDDVPEYVIERQTLGEMAADSGTVQQEAASGAEQSDREKPSEDRRSGSTVTVQFSRQLEYVDDEETAAGGVVPTDSAWSRDETERLESRADNVLVETLPTSSADGRRLDVSIRVYFKLADLSHTLGN